MAWKSAFVANKWKMTLMLLKLNGGLKINRKVWISAYLSLRNEWLLMCSDPRRRVCISNWEYAQPERQSPQWVMYKLCQNRLETLKMLHIKTASYVALMPLPDGKWPKLTLTNFSDKLISHNPNVVSLLCNRLKSNSKHSCWVCWVN